MDMYLMLNLSETAAIGKKRVWGHRKSQAEWEDEMEFAET